MSFYLLPGILIILVVALGLYLYTLNFVKLTEKAYPPLGEFVEVDGIKLHYIKKGSGPSLVIIHGASSSLRDVPDDLIDELAIDFTVYAFDRPGHGYSGRPQRQGHDPAVQAELIRRALKSLDVGNAVLFGHSWAGALVTAYALDHPDEVNGLVLVSAATHPWEGPPSWYNRMVRLPIVGSLALNTCVVPLGQVFVSAGVAKNFDPNPSAPNYAEKVGTALLLRPDTFRANADDTVMLKEFVREQSKRYHELTMPVVIVTGDQDGTVSPYIHSFPLHETVPDSELVLLEGVGHMPHHVEQAAVINAVRRFAGRRE